MKGRAVPLNPPDKQQLGPTSPFGNPYPNNRELIKTTQAIQPPLSFFHCHVTLYHPMSTHHPPTSWVSNFSTPFILLYFITLP